MTIQLNKNIFLYLFFFLLFFINANLYAARLTFKNFLLSGIVVATPTCYILYNKSQNFKKEFDNFSSKTQCQLLSLILSGKIKWEELKYKYHEMKNKTFQKRKI